MVFSPLLVCYSFLLAAVFLLFCYFTGWALSLLWRNNRSWYSFHQENYYTIFLKISGGLFFLTGVYAIIVTKGNSSLLPVPLLCISLFKNQERQLNLLEKLNWKKLLLFFLTALFLYWFYFILHFIPSDSSHINYLEGDISFYARAAEWLNLHGQENVNLDPLGVADVTKEPYHYGDIWAIALLQKVTGLHPLIITYFILYPVCISLFVFGILSWISARFNIKKNLPFFLILLGGFVSGINLLFPGFIIPAADPYALPILYYPKLVYPSVLLIALANTFYRKEWRQTILLTGLSCLLYINIALPLFLTVSCIYFFTGYKIVGLINKYIVPDLILCILSLVYYLFFYSASSQTVSSSENFSFKIFANIIAGGVLQIVPLIPFFLLFLVYVIKSNRHTGMIRKISPDLVYLLLLLPAGLISWASLYWMTKETVQFFNNLFVPVQAVLIILLIIQMLNSTSRIFRITGLVLFFISVFFNLRKSPRVESIPRADFIKTEQFLSSHGQGIFINFRDTSEIKGFGRNTIVYPPLLHVYYIRENYTNISMNTPQLVTVDGSTYSKLEMQTLEGSPFKAFVDQQAPGKTLDEYALLFVNKYKPRYIMVSPKTTLAHSLVSMTNDSLSLSSGWKIFSLKPN